MKRVATFLASYKRAIEDCVTALLREGERIYWVEEDGVVEIYTL